ncbi:MAG: trimeric intracellular cation channel family protein [Salaquimonas sp.]
MSDFNWLLVLDYCGVAVFAATGALAASRKQLDIIGFIFLASFTGIGGGTLRDLVLGQTPVFWIVNPNYILVCLAAAVVVYLFAHLLESRYRALLWLDAIGLAAFCVMGAANGHTATGSITVAIITGMLSATFGGILRDVLSGEPSVIMRPEIYVSAALAGALIYTLGIVAGMPEVWAAGIAAALSFAIRGAAIVYGWSMPKYRPRAGRSEEELKQAGIIKQDQD